MALSDGKFTPDIQDGDVGRSPVKQVELTANGAISDMYEVVFLNKAGVLAATLSTPPEGMDGAIMRIVSLTAQAHTVTQSDPGFNSAGTAGDVATFDGGIGDAMEIVAKDGVWYTVSLNNVTLG